MKTGQVISKVTEGIYRGPRLDDLILLKKLGIKSVLDLENDKTHHFSEAKQLHTMGILTAWHPMSEIKRPGEFDLKACVGTIEEKEYHPIYVHCKHGQDRTGYVIAAYRMLVQGWTFKRAYQEAKDMGHKWWFAPYLFWPKSLKELK